MAMHGSLLLARENKQLREANERQKRKRAQKRSYISTRGLLTIAEGLQRVEANRVTKRVAKEVEGVQSQQLRQRAPPRCSICNSLLHKAPRCPSLQRAYR